MGLLDVFEKVINEHGSAAIRGERLVQAKEQIALFEKRLAESEAKAEKLDLQLRESEKKEERLKQTIQDLQKHHDSPQLEFMPPFYYAPGDPVPYCPTCWESKRKAIHYPPPESISTGPLYTCQTCGKWIVYPRKEPEDERATFSG
jgi:hypothetical protein